MTTSSNGQSASKMLRRLFVVLTLCGFIATCACSVVRSNIHEESLANVDCTVDGNSTACANKIPHDDSSNKPMEGSRVSRMVGEGFLTSEDDGVEGVTARKKDKGKGYGKLLVYFMGAAKISMLYMMIHAVAALAGKALIVGKVALAIATALLLKKSIDHGDKVSYEIIKHPHHSYVQTHSSSVDYDHHSGFGESSFGHRKRRRVLR